MQRKRLGDVLLEKGTLHRDELDRALSLQQQKNARLGEVLLHGLHISKDEIASAIEEVQGVKYAACPPLRIAPEALAMIPREVAMKCCALPLEYKNNLLVVALAEPQDLKLIDELRFRSGRQVSARFSFREDIVAGIRRFYDKDAGVGELVLKESTVGEDTVPADPEEEDALTGLELIVTSTREENKELIKELRAGVKKRSLAVRFLSLILARAAAKEATDLSIEPRVNGLAVRMRVDGVLREVLKIPAGHQIALVSRIKALADMDPAEQRRAQDGRFLLSFKGNKLDVQVYSLPTHLGEQITLRLLDPRRTTATLDQLGLSPQQFAAMKRVLDLPQGALIVTGPLGSGKSTTLYAALNFVNSPARNVVTIEDPVEYTLDGITQIQVAADRNAEASLKVVLRQNPNVIMLSAVGERETTETLLRASQIGQLVMTTLHASDSVGAVQHLRHLGVPPQMIGSISGIVAQRLLRRMCSCGEQVPPTEDFKQNLRIIGYQGEITGMAQPAGCSACANTGYKGRMGIYEVLLVAGIVRDAIYDNATEEQLRVLLKETGFRTMQDHALEKAAQGLTTLDEVVRVVRPDPLAHGFLCDCGRSLARHFQYCPFCGVPVRSTTNTSVHSPERLRTR
jgi:type IV pilus assembly protein PilB